MFNKYFNCGGISLFFSKLKLWIKKRLLGMIGTTNVKKATSINFYGLKFTATENSSIGYTIVGTPTGNDLSYSFNGVLWTAWDGTAISLNQGQYVYIKGNNPNGLNNASGIIYFTMSGEVSASGNINSLLDNSDGSQLANNEIPNSHCFRELFRDCSALTTIPTLPATTLKDSCYLRMFENCTSLTDLSSVALPATTLTANCYYNMFAGCTSLTHAPNLLGITLATSCYYGMFSNCSSLRYIRLSYTGNFDNNFNQWVYGVQTTAGDFYYNGNDTTRASSSNSYKGIPQNWVIYPSYTVTINCTSPNSSIVHIRYNNVEYTGSTTKTIAVDYDSTVEYWATATDYYESSHVTESNITASQTYNITALTQYPLLTINYTGNPSSPTIKINGTQTVSKRLPANASYSYSIEKTNYITKTGNGTMPSTDTTISVTNNLDLKNIDMDVSNANATIYSETLYEPKILDITLTGGAAMSSNVSTYSGVQDKYDLATGGSAQCITPAVIPAGSIITIKSMAGGYGYYYNVNGGVGISLWIKQPTDNEAVCVLVAGGAGCGRTYFNFTQQMTYYYAAGGGGYNGGFAECYSSGAGTGTKQNTSGYSIDGSLGTNTTFIANTATGQYSQKGDTNRGGTGYKDGICANATLTNGTRTTELTTQPIVDPGHVTITFS